MFNVYQASESPKELGDGQGGQIGFYKDWVTESLGCELRDSTFTNIFQICT